MSPTRRSVYRRSRRLIAYWRDGGFVIHPFMRGRALPAPAELVEMLSRLSEWTPVEAFAKTNGLGRDRARRLLNRLAGLGLVDQSILGDSPEVETAWDVWQEAAAFLHFSTRDHAFRSPSQTQARLAVRAAHSPPPPSTKAYVGFHRLPLPTSPRATPFESVVRKRRTWRRFGYTRPALSDLAAVLDLTFRVQRWVDLGGAGRVMLRTSPSGGARHPTEAYLLVRRVAGLASGAYYYAPEEHALVVLRRSRVTGQEITELLVGQRCYAKAAVIVVMTAVFERTAWKYRTARSYKSVLIEAGHFAQTFCLASTARRLAPFSTAAFAAGKIEALLGLDPERESALYVTGFGASPGVDWAPLPQDETDSLG